MSKKRITKKKRQEHLDSFDLDYFDIDDKKMNDLEKMISI